MVRFAVLANDTALLDWARECAPQMLDRFPQLAERHIARWLGVKAEFLKA
jgi:ATP-dependent DNA helicase RecG